VLVTESGKEDAPAVGLRDDRQLEKRRHLALAPLGWVGIERSDPLLEYNPYCTAIKPQGSILQKSSGEH